MEMIWVVLMVFVILVAVALAISGAVFAFSKFRTGSGVRIPLRLLLRLYIYVVIIVGLLLLTQGVTELARAGLAGAGGKDFSYRPVFVNIPGEQGLRAPKPVELKDRAELTEAELEELSLVLAEREEKSLELRREARLKGLDRALKEGIIKGLTFTIVGALIWIAHVLGRGWLETREERESPINRIYLILVVVMFGVITLVNLPQGIFEGFRFYLLDPLDEFGRNSPPGDKLGLAIATAPIWIIYLAGAIRAVRRGS